MMMQEQSRRVMIAGFNVRSLIVFTTCVGIFTSVLAISTAAVVADDHDAMRSWNSRNGKSIEASLVSFRDDHHVATLKQSDGTVIEVPFKSLSRKDQRYIKTWLRQQRNTDSEAKANAGQDDSKAAESQSQNNTRSATSGKSIRATEKTKTMYGINWHKSGEPALASARGDASTQDDRPIMWFRVLGDLEGFM